MSVIRAQWETADDAPRGFLFEWEGKREQLDVPAAGQWWTLLKVVDEDDAEEMVYVPTRTISCDDCGGDGYLVDHLDHGKKEYWTCEECEGSGEISQYDFQKALAVPVFNRLQRLGLLQNALYGEGIGNVEWWQPMSRMTTGEE